MIIASVYPPNSDMLPSYESQIDFVKKRKYCSFMVRRFDFSSSLQRMSVICRNKFDDQFRVFAKGSPEKILELCE